MRNGEEVEVLRGHEDCVTSVAISHNEFVYIFIYTFTMNVHI